MATAPAAFLTWIDLTAADRNKVRQVLDLFREQGTVDELGLGTLRDLLSDTLFPGTSVLHTRMRYVLFIPWIYQQMERDHKRISNVAGEARAREVQLIKALKAGDGGLGIIGAEAQDALARLPSSSYWAALVRWGIFVPRQSQSWYHQHFKRLANSEPPGRADDPGVTWTQEPTWHPRLPEAPTDLLESASFQMTREEAEFVQGCIQTRVNGSLLAWLAAESSTALSASAAPWEEPKVWEAPSPIRHAAELARRFSLHVEGTALLYNLLLAETRSALTGDPNGTDSDHIEHYRARIHEWAAREDDEAAFDPNALWALAAQRGFKIKTPQKRFVECWAAEVNGAGAASVADCDALRQLIEKRERALKGGRARTVNRSRLLDWRGGAGVGRMLFRWPQVRQILTDLHQRLAN